MAAFRRCALGSLLTTVAAAGMLSVELAAESAPVARGQAEVVGKDCLQCHGVPANEGTRAAGYAAMGSHPKYEGRSVDVLAYFEAVRLVHTHRERSKVLTPSRLLEGEQLARRVQCFTCHGELGQGGFRNPGSLKGYIPGFFGSDFDELTDGGGAGSVRAWITMGVDPALYANPLTGPIAKHFLKRQTVKMPSYRTMTESEIDLLIDYVLALRRYGPMGVAEVQAYARASGDTRSRPVRDWPSQVPHPHPDH